MSTIETGYLLNTLRQTAPIEPTQRTQQTAKQEIEQSIEEFTPIVPEEVSTDRYSNSMQGASVKSVESLNEQASLMRDSTAFVLMDASDFESTTDVLQNLFDNPIQTPPENPQAPQKMQTADLEDTISAKVADRVSVAIPDMPEMQIANLERDVDPVYSREVQVETREQPVQTIQDPSPLPTQDVALFRQEPDYKQDAINLQGQRDLTNTSDTVLEPIDMDEILPDPETFAEERARHSVEESTKRNANQVEEYADKQTTKNLRLELDEELMARKTAREDMRSGIPTEAQPVLEVEAQLPIDPVYSTKVADQAIETGPLPSAESVITSDAIPEAVAINQTMLEHYAPVETHTQPEVEVDLSKFEAPEPVEPPVPVDDTKSTEEIINEREQGQEFRVQETEQRQGDAAAQAIATQNAALEQTQATRAAQDENRVQATATTNEITDATPEPVEDYFPELPGTGTVESTDTPPLEDFFPELPGSGNTAEAADLPDAEDYFAPLPGSENTNTEDFFAPLPGSGEIDNSAAISQPQKVLSLDEFLETNPIFQVADPTDDVVTTGAEEPSLQDFLGAGVSTLSQDDLAYQRVNTMSNYTIVEEQFGAQDDSAQLTENMAEDYSPFDVQEEEWIQEAINRTSVGHFAPYGLDIGTGEVDMTQFEDAVPEPTDNTIEAQEYIEASLDRVIEYNVEREDSRIDESPDIEEIFNGRK